MSKTFTKNARFVFKRFSNSFVCFNQISNSLIKSNHLNSFFHILISSSKRFFLRITKQFKCLIHPFLIDFYFILTLIFLLTVLFKSSLTWVFNRFLSLISLFSHLYQMLITFIFWIRVNRKDRRLIFKISFHFN